MTLFTRIRTVVGGVAVLGAAAMACYGGADLPTAARSPAALAISAARGANGHGAQHGRDTSVVHFTVDPTQSTTYNIGGGNKLWVRARGICDLDSPYGPQYWDTPCRPTRKSVQVTAHTWTDSAGHPRVDFQPKLRFVTAGGLTSAIVYLRDHTAAEDPSSVILYCGGGICVDESTGDPTLHTFKDRPNGFVFRPIKHFSGYEVAVGRSDTYSQPALY